MPKKIEGYKDQQYDRSKDHLSVLQQIYEDIRRELDDSCSWNIPVADTNGLSMKVGGNVLELCWIRYETTTPELLAVQEKEGAPFFKEFEKEMKKRFKKQTKTTIVLKKVGEDLSYEKIDRMTGETSQWFGVGSHMTTVDKAGKYLIREKKVYEFSFK